MKQALLIIQMIISIFLIGAILLQARGTGLGSTWGGGGESYRSKRGVEKILLVSTVFLTVFFLITAIINLAV
jgi:protein translocase SecG subunit